MDYSKQTIAIAPSYEGRLSLNNQLGAETETAEAFRSLAPDNSPFLESNTSAITLEELNQNIIPTFADQSLTISHNNFINVVRTAAENIYGELSPVEIRVSHPIIGRKPEAIHKKSDQLTENDKTLFYQRIAWLCRIRSISRVVNGQILHLCIGGVRAYNEDKLYSRKTPEKFRIFVGFKILVCSNLCLTCDGYSGNVECLTEADIFQKSLELFSRFQPLQERNLQLLENLHQTRLSEEQFCQIVGRLRLLTALPTSRQNELPRIELGDSVINAAVRNFVSNPNFGKQQDEDSISCWQLMNILNESVKSCYIDTWLQRNQNCTDFAIGIQNAINHTDESYSWFLN